MGVKGNHEEDTDMRINETTITAEGVEMRYTVVLRPTQNIDANWVRIGFNNRPGMDDVVYYKGQEFKVASIRKNF